jgi:hypothetical protein
MRFSLEILLMEERWNKGRVIDFLGSAIDAHHILKGTQCYWVFSEIRDAHL